MTNEVTEQTAEQTAAEDAAFEAQIELAEAACNWAYADGPAAQAAALEALYHATVRYGNASAAAWGDEQTQ